MHITFVVDFPPCEAGEYRCSNHRCVSSDKLCDAKQDCEDNSDEYGCGIFNFTFVVLTMLVSSFYSPIYAQRP